MANHIRIILIVIFCFPFFSCSSKKNGQTLPRYTFTTPQILPEFNHDNAYRRIEAQLNLGPRNPGSPGHAAALDYLYSELIKYTPHVNRQEFTYTGYEGEKLKFTNLIAKFNPGSQNRIMLCAHWDTRPRAERDPDPELRDQPILGANDGGSGTAVLLEIASNLKDFPVSYGVDIVLFDGEDYGRTNDISNFCLGSKYFAARIESTYNPVFALLIDLIGDSNALFYREAHSEQYAPDVTDIVWKIASELGMDKFINRKKAAIYDDHVPLNQAGIKTVNIVDMDLINENNSVNDRDYWHTHGDTMDKISSKTLEQVGTVINYLLYSIKFEFDGKNI